MFNVIYSFTTKKQRTIIIRHTPFLHVFSITVCILFGLAILRVVLFVNSDNLTHISSFFFCVRFYTYLLRAYYYYHFRFLFEMKCISKSFTNSIRRFKMCFESEVVNVLGEHCSQLIEVLLMHSHHRDDVSRVSFLYSLRRHSFRFEYERWAG